MQVPRRAHREDPTAHAEVALLGCALVHPDAVAVAAVRRAEAEYPPLLQHRRPPLLDVVRRVRQSLPRIAHRVIAPTRPEQLRAIRALSAQTSLAS